jgi:phage/plasmid-like protein (TIGR03299 family)
MTDLLNSVLSETSKGNGGARIVSEQHDSSKINWVRGMSDPGEMISCGYLPQLRRRTQESDADYAARIWPMVDALPQRERDIILGRVIKAAVNRANLMTRNGRVAMFSAMQAPWHELGTLVNQAATSQEALEFAQLAGWDLRKVEQQIQWDGRLIPTGSYAIVRGDNGNVLTKGKAVGKGYTVFSNEQGFEFVDDIIGQSNARYETAGALGSGETVWMLAKMPQDIQVAPGDTLRQYLLCGLSHDGSSAIYCVPTDERVVCGNTYRIAMGGKQQRFAFRHTKNVMDRAKQVAKMLGIVHIEQDQFAQRSRHLASTPMVDTNEYFAGCIDDIVDVTIAGQQLTRKSYNSGDVLKAILAVEDIDEKHTAEKALERAITRRKEVLADILERYESERCNGLASISGTVWSAVNAVTEFADHSPLNRFKGTDQERKESRFQSVIDGRADEIKQSALARAMEYAR